MKKARPGARLSWIRAEPADKPGSVVGNHSSRRIVTDTLKQPTRRHRGPRHCLPIWSCSRWGLPCRSVARLAVRSYRTVSPLPRTSCDAVRRSALCCTFRRLAPPRRYLAPCPVEPGLSSACLRMTRLPGRLRRGRLYGSGCANAAGTAIGFSGLNTLACPAYSTVPIPCCPFPLHPRTAPCVARRSTRPRAWPPSTAAGGRSASHRRVGLR